MNPDRWERIQLLFEEALAQPEEVRSTFIDAACGDDLALRNEVVSLLSARLHHGDRQVHELVQELPTLWLGALGEPKLPRFHAGDRIAGRYRLGRLLGRGGMGEVYEAWDRELAISVALKTLHLAGNEEALRRLKLESALARSVSHPNVCRVYDLGRHGHGDDTVWFLTMELLRGQTLAERLHEESPLPLDQALRFAEQMAAGLAAAHQAGVVHRDFKPGNIMLVGQGPDESVVIMDFGLARGESTRALVDEGEERGIVDFGTPAYMAPEQVLGETVGPRADIYALGIVLYEMTTGTLPFTGRSAIEVGRRRLETDAPSPRTVRPELEERWEKVILRCLARDPSRRFGRAEEVIEALGGREEGSGGQGTTDSRHTLPTERDSFVGRDAEIQALQQQFAGNTRLVTLLGAAGMGKTRLAVHYGWRSLGEWPGGVWFCDLTDARSLEGLVSKVGSTLGIQLERKDPINQLGNAIAGRRRCLVILDNVEQILDLAAKTLTRWLDLAEEARFVVTSRERLNLRHEHVQKIEPLSPELGVQLFENRARWLLPGLKLDGTEAESARVVVRFLEGIPLAIELAAARMRVMSATQLMAQMQKRFRLLTGGPGVRHETLAAAIDGSWDLLHDWEKAAWAQCAVFEGGFTLEAAEAVMDLDPWPEKPWVVDVIQSLVDRSLLRRWVIQVGPRAGAQVRFGMYVSLQEYARIKLRRGNEAASRRSREAAERAAEERHGKWYARYGTDEAIEALDLVGGVGRRLLALDLENLIAACRRAMAREDEETSVATYRASWAVLELRGPYSTALDLGHQLLATRLSSESRAKTLTTLGQAALRLGHSDEANSHYATALALYREMGNRHFEAVVLGHLAAIYFQKGQMRETIDHYESALALACATGDRHLEGRILANLGSSHARWGRMEVAESTLEAALAIQRDMGDRRFEGIVLGNLGNLRMDQGRVEEAKTHYEAALAIHREVGNRRMEGLVLTSLAGLYFHHGRMDEARSCYEAAITNAREIGNKELEGIAIGSLGIVYMARNQLEDARTHFEAALKLHRQHNNRSFEASVLTSMGEVLIRQGRLSESRRALVESAAICRQLEDAMELGKVLCARAELELRTGDRAAAQGFWVEAEAIAIQAGSGPDSNLGRFVAELREKLAVSE